MADQQLTLQESPYCLNGNVTIEEGVTVTVDPGVEVQSENSQLVVFGNLIVDGASFTGSGRLSIGQNDGGGLTSISTPGHIEATNALFEWNVGLGYGSTGFVDSSTFGPDSNLFYGSNVTGWFEGSVTHNVFQSSDSVSTVVPQVDDLTNPAHGNQWSVPSTIKVRGSDSGSSLGYYELRREARFHYQPNLTYELTSTLNITGPGHLIVDAGVTVRDGLLNVWSGRVTADGATFAGEMQILVRDRGSFIASNSVFDLQRPGGDELVLQPTSFNRFSFNSFSNFQLDIYSDSNTSFRCNDLSDASVRALGPREDRLDLRSNYWGTTDPLEIAEKIIDQEDQGARPPVDFDPFLSSPFAPCSTEPIDVSIPLESVAITPHSVPGNDVISVEWSTANGGTDPTGQFVTQLVLSDDDVLDDDDSLLDSVSMNSLGPGETRTTTHQTTVPSGRADGDYFVFVVADPLGALSTETITSNNVAWSSLRIQSVDDIDVYNDANPVDISGDGILSPLDPLLVINELQLRQFTNPISGRIIGQPPASTPYPDANNDGLIAAVDVLMAINALVERDALSSGLAVGLPDEHLAADAPANVSFFVHDSPEIERRQHSVRTFLPAELSIWADDGEFKGRYR